MIRVSPQPEPVDFDRRVRQPGRQALAAGVEKLPDHWRHCLVDLWRAYGGVCAYLCHYIPRGTGDRSVEHFAPKSLERDVAYEWSNYRLACSLMNSRKRDFQDVLDPFEIDDGWFQLEARTLQVFPSPGLASALRDQVEATIKRLKLNDEECLAARREYVDHFNRRELSVELLRKWAPFLARELERQGLLSPGGG